MTVIDRVPYWDGGLFDNTPIESLLDLLTEEELESLPIFIVNLFALTQIPQRTCERCRSGCWKSASESFSA